MPTHASLSGTDLHENKGVASASDNTVATASAGATVWQKVNADMLDTSVIFDTNKAYLTTSIADVSTLETVWLVVPFTGTLTKVSTVLQNAITVADSILTVRNNAGTSMGTITVAFTGSAPGDVDTLVPSSNNTFTNGQTVRIGTDGGSTTASRLFITLEFTITA